MRSTKKRIVNARKRLAKLQAEQAAMAKAIDRARRKLDKRSMCLRSLESKIAKAERRAYALAHQNGQQWPGPALALRRAYLIFNPTSGPEGKEGRSPEALVEALRAHGIEAEVGFKTSGKVARQLTCEALERKHDLLIAAGGDGTIEDVASQLVGTEAVLGILPVGSRNNLARELGVPLDVNLACELLAAGITRKVDIGRVRADARRDVEFFLETAGLGMTAVLFPAGQDLRKHRFGNLSAAVRKLFEMRPGPVEIDLDGNEKVTANSQVVTVSNAPMIGLNQMIAPDAKMDDGLLDIAVYDGMTTTDLAGYFLNTTKGRRSTNGQVRFYRAKRVVIRSGEPLAVVSDTDSILERQELEIEILPRALNAIVGSGMALTLPVEAVPAVPPLAGPQPAATTPAEAATASDKAPAAKTPVPEAVPA
jgi:YegS/Rv2252/BmrU family lipid kinase